MNAREYTQAFDRGHNWLLLGKIVAQVVGCMASDTTWRMSDGSEWVEHTSFDGDVYEYSIREVQVGQ